MNRIGTFFLIIVFFATPLLAQDPAAAADTATITALQRQLAALEKRVALLDAPPSPSPASVSGQVFSYFAYTTTGVEGKDFNRFEFDRLYITVKGGALDNMKYQVTTDVYRNALAGTYYSGLAVRLKLAFVDYSPIAAVSVKAGMIGGPWTGFIDGYWKYRGIASSYVDRNGYYASADLGISAHYQLPGKFGEVAAFVLNGSGYASPEANRFKDYALRVNLTPFTDAAILKNLTLAGYAYKGATTGTAGVALRRDRIGILAGYADSHISGYVEAGRRLDAVIHPDTTTVGNGLSFFGEVKAPFEKYKNTVALVLRYDVAEPNIDKGGDMARLAIIGVAYRFNEKCQFVLDRQVLTTESATLKRADNAKIDYDERWYVHALITF